MLSLEFFWGGQKHLKEQYMTNIEKLALSCEFWATKRLLFRGPKGPNDCIFTCFFARLLRGSGGAGPGKFRVIMTPLGPYPLARG